MGASLFWKLDGCQQTGTATNSNSVSKLTARTHLHGPEGDKGIGRSSAPCLLHISLRGFLVCNTVLSPIFLCSPGFLSPQSMSAMALGTLSPCRQFPLWGLLSHSLSLFSLWGLVPEFPHLLPTGKVAVHHGCRTSFLMVCEATPTAPGSPTE